MRGVAGQEHPALPEPLGERRARPEAGGPVHPAERRLRQVGAGRDGPSHALRRGLGLRVVPRSALCPGLRAALRAELGEQLERGGARQRAEQERAAGRLRPDVPVPAVQAVDLQIGDQGRARVYLLARHRDAHRPADGGAAAVGGDQVAGGDGPLGAVGAGQPGLDPVRVLVEAAQRGAEDDLAAEFAQPLVQQLLGAPLREHPDRGERHGRVRGDRPGAPDEVPLALRLAVLPAQHPGVGPTGGMDGGEQAEVLEDLLGPGLESLAARAGEQRPGLLDQQRGDSAPGEVAGEGQAGRAGADDKDLGPGRGVRHHELSLTLLSS